MKTGDTFLGKFSLEREDDGWRLTLVAANNAILHMYLPDQTDSAIGDVHGIHLSTFARNALLPRTWGTEGMEGL